MEDEDDDFSIWGYPFASLETLIGKTLSMVYKPENSDLMLILKVEGAEERYGFYHQQDCCESVYLEDVVGDLDNLIGNPILVAEEISDTTRDEQDEWGGIVQYTYYKLATIKGHVDLRFCGSSNGYYSVGVNFVRV